MAISTKPNPVAPFDRSAKAVLGTFRGILSQRNTSDDYTLTVTRRGRFSASLTCRATSLGLE
ncbi:MAG: hypothetical protein HC769_09970 [Cyanobacteria bacterium CRU_2_1]|nr:hypothetical protein [Cyanobacteria bacterium CRU_2_1]